LIQGHIRSSGQLVPIATSAIQFGHTIPAMQESR